ncbi:diguanylate cyclase [Salinicola sp. LHM]|uniref:sensor domain-containing diguanylate cyclase n=1 Tax=Salinicola sp. LHM TaxID=3065298 RepID=UPI002ACE7000|nr:diguanylate cyclase [Salinicola sp. LHM]WQH33683.1 diguanylate cyclase [Salinicola sp. LHM]
MSMVLSRLSLYLALPALLLGLWPDGEPDQYWILLLLGLLWLGQFAALRQRIGTSRWLLIPTGILTLAIIASFLIAEHWVSVDLWQRGLDFLPGHWELFHSRPPILALCMIFGLILNVLLLSRLGLGSPITLLLVAMCGAWLGYRWLTPPPEHASSLNGIPLPMLVALWLLWAAQGLSLFPTLRRYWRRILLPLLVGGLIALLAMVSWQEQRQTDDLRLYALAASEGNRIATLLATETDDHVKAMRRFASFWNMLGHVPTRSEWEQQAKRYHDDFGYFRNIAFIDLDGTVIRVYPLRGNQSNLDLNLYKSYTLARKALDRSLIYGIEGQTGIVDFLQGGRGIINYLPVRNLVDGTLLGAVSMSVSVDTLLNSLLAQTSNRNQAITLSGNGQLYFHYGPLGDLADWRYQQMVEMGTDRLILSVRPSLSWLQAMRSRLPEITLIFGILLAYLLHMVLYIYRRLAHQHRLANQANASLREEIKERERLQQEIEWIASHDELTQLPNRRELMHWMDACEHPLPLAVLICDLDHFKSVNDHFGHLEGDRYLKTIAERCRLPVERAGGMFARYGGEEFVACLPNCDRHMAGKIAESIRRTVAQSGLVLPNDEPVTLSIGVSVTDSLPLQRNRIFQTADDSLYRAKQEGRNRVVLAEPSESTL